MIEGFIGKLGRAYWMVRGAHSIGGGRLALPRYIHTPAGLRTVKEADESVRVAWELEPSSLTFAECFGRTVPIISPTSFSEVLDPRMGPANVGRGIESKGRELIEIIRREIGSGEVGVTGGLLVGKQTDDIDLIVYGRDNCIGAREVLYRERILERYTPGEAVQLMERRGQRPLTLELVERESRKTLQGKFRGVEVYVRLVPFLPENPPECRRKVTKLGETLRFVEISDASASFLYPCTYVGIDLNTGQKIKIYSERGRYCELMDEGELAAVRGEIELVEEEGKRETQLNLWRRDHYLLPLARTGGFKL